MKTAVSWTIYTSIPYSMGSLFRGENRHVSL